VKSLRRWGLRLLLLLAPAMVLFWSRAVWLTWAARSLDVSNPPSHVDCLMVLGGGSQTRPFVAADWLLRGKSAAVLVPTVHMPPELVDEASVPDHEVIRRVLLAQGVRPEAITLLPGACSSTRDEANALAAYLTSHPGISVAIVTNTLYTRRTRSIVSRQLGDNASRVCYIGAPTDHFDETNWWKMEEGFYCYATEFLKLTAYWLSF
jgi:uncharacterized SAM-binding protein YcdF (DUF218 family)